jgi:hypothetical protein
MSHVGQTGAGVEVYYAPPKDVPKEVTIYRDGRLLEIDSWRFPTGPTGEERKGGGKRGKVVEFSAQSRLRLIRALCKLAIVPEHCLFVTLTYPAEFPTEAAEIKAHFAAMVKRLKRSLPGISGYAKVEPQKRGAPHWHLLLFGERFSRAKVEALRRWMAKGWYEVVGSGDPKHFRAGTQVKVPTTVNGTMAYLCKYLGKTCTGLPPGLRYWRVINRKELPVSETVKVELSVAEGIRLKRLLRRLVRSHARQGQVRRLKKLVSRNVPWQLFMGHSGLRGGRHREPLPKLVLAVFRRDACKGWRGDSFGRAVIATGCELLRLVNCAVGFVGQPADAPNLELRPF